MGLDIVEMVMRVEEEFGITIEDEEASYIDTVGQLQTLILSKTGLLHPRYCQSSATFYQLRRALTDLAVAPRPMIRPATSVSELLPAAQRRRIWENWGESAGVKLPELEKPKWMNAALCLAFGLALFIGPFFWVTSNFVVCSYYATAFAMCALLSKWSQLHAVHLPADCATVGSVTKAVMKLNYGINAEPRDAQSAEAIWEKLKEIVADEIGVEPDLITRDADFIRDLGMG